jgi:hypothetical protein
MAAEAKPVHNEPASSSSQVIKSHCRAISPSAACEPAGMFTMRSPSPIGLSVLLGSQRSTQQRGSARAITKPAACPTAVSEVTKLLEPIRSI